MFIRFMLFGYALIACALSFHLGASVTFYPEGVVYDSPYVTYWFDYGVAQ